MKAFDKIINGQASALCGFYIGRDSALRDGWIERARKEHDAGARRICAKAARDLNRQVVRQMRLIRLTHNQ